MSNHGGAVRADPFSSLDDSLSDFTPAVPTNRRPEAAAVREIAEKHNFPSRAPKSEKPAASEPKTTKLAPPKREQRRHRTGRNIQVNMKVSAATLEKLVRISDERGWVYGEALEHALDALEAQKETNS